MPQLVTSLHPTTLLYMLSALSGRPAALLAPQLLPMDAPIHTAFLTGTCLPHIPTHHTLLTQPHIPSPHPHPTHALPSHPHPTHALPSHPHPTLTLPSHPQPTLTLPSRPPQSTVSSGGWRDLFWTIFLPYTHFHFKFLPAITRKQKESAEGFANRSQQVRDTSK